MKITKNYDKLNRFKDTFCKTQLFYTLKTLRVM